MCWRKRDLWKAGIVVAGVLLFLVLMRWVPVSAADAHEGASESATPTMVTVQATPTVDATVTALNKEKLVHENDWRWNYGATILTSLISTLTLAAAGVFTVLRYFNDRKIEREKRAEERFQAVVEGLGSEREEAKVGAAITLRTFLRPGYEQFYTQTFDLAVAHLRLRRTSPPPFDPDATPHSPEDPNAPLRLTTLRQALIVVFKEAFHLARSQNKGGPQSLDATYIQLDNAYLVGADLEQAWMPDASLREANLKEANLRRADLSGAKLSGAKLSGAYLFGAKLSGADLSRADLSEAKLSEADLSEAYLSMADLSEAVLFRAYLSMADLSEAVLFRAHLSGANLFGAKLAKASLNRAHLREANLSMANLKEANLSMANLKEANLRRADLSGAKLSGAKLSGTDLFGADLSGADLSGADLSEAKLLEANLEDAFSLEKAILRGVIELTKEQLQACKAKGAIIDEDTTTNPPFHL